MSSTNDIEKTAAGGRLKRHDLCLWALVSSIGLLFGLSAQAQSLGLRTEYHFEGGAMAASEGADNSQRVGFTFDPQFSYHLNTNVSFRLVPEIYYETGRVQTRFEDLDRNGLSVKDGYISLTTGPADPISGTLELGVFRMGEMQLPLMTSRGRSFPGLREDFKWAFAPLELGIKARQFIPSSKSMNSYREDTEALPILRYEELSFGLNSIGRMERTTFRIGHFAWNSLPAKVAYESSRFGNSTTGESSSNTHFLFGFDGWVAALETQIRVARSLSLVGEIQHYSNEQAPSDSRDAEWLKIGIRAENARHAIDLKLARYYIESDVTPAYYSNWNFGRTNRIGNGAKIEWSLKNQHLVFFAEVIDATPIVPSSIQGDFKYYYFGLEAQHAAL